MKITLAPKKDGYYGIKVDSVVSPVTEETLQYIINDKFYDQKGIYDSQGKHIVMLQNGIKFSVVDKSDFIGKLKQAHSDVAMSEDISNFEVI